MDAVDEHEAERFARLLQEAEDAILHNQLTRAEYRLHEACHMEWVLKSQRLNPRRITRLDNKYIAVTALVQNRLAGRRALVAKMRFNKLNRSVTIR